MAKHVDPILPSTSLQMIAAKIAVQGVSKQFDQGGNPVQALATLDLTIGEGEFVSIVGPSGCGKSTLLYMLGGFIAADAGRLLVDGREITGPGVDRGVVFQEYALFPVADGVRQHRVRPARERECRRQRSAPRPSAISR